MNVLFTGLTGAMRVFRTMMIIRIHTELLEHNGHHNAASSCW